MTSSPKSSTIYYAKKIIDDDYELYPGLVNSEQLIAEMKKSEVGRQALDFIEHNNVVVKMDYEKPYHYNRGKQEDNYITLYMANIGGSPLVAAQTAVHEVCHLKYRIGECQWAEAVCMCHEKMHKENRTWLTFPEKRKIVRLAKQAYSELNWKKGGVINGKRI